MNERLEQDLMKLQLAEPSADLDARVLELLRVEEPLRQMKLREPRAELDARVASLFADEAPPAPYSFAVFAASAARIGVAVAACLAIGLTVFFATRDTDSNMDVTGAGLATTITPPTAAEIAPVRYDSTVVNDEAGDVIILDDELPVVPIRRQAIQKTRWVDEKNNVEIEMTVPHEQMLIVPMRVD